MLIITLYAAHAITLIFIASLEKSPSDEGEPLLPKLLEPELTYASQIYLVHANDVLGFEQRILNAISRSVPYVLHRKAKFTRTAAPVPIEFKSNAHAPTGVTGNQMINMESV